MKHFLKSFWLFIYVLMTGYDRPKEPKPLNTKFLKRIRKRFDWYFNSEGFPVLIDRKTKEVETFTPNKYKDIKEQIEKHKEEPDNKVDEYEYAWRVMKDFMYRAVTPSTMNKINDRINYRIAERNKNRYPNHKYKPTRVMPWSKNNES